MIGHGPERLNGASFAQGGGWSLLDVFVIARIPPTVKANEE